MKLKLHPLFLSPLLLIWTACNHTESNIEPEDVKFIQTVLTEQLKAWNEGDIDGFMAGYWESDSLRFSGSTGTTYGYETLRNSYHKSFPNRDDMGQLFFQVDTIYKDREPFIEVKGEWTIHRHDTIGGHFVLTFKEFGSVWKIVQDHTW